MTMTMTMIMTMTITITISTEMEKKRKLLKEMNEECFSNVFMNDMRERDLGRMIEMVQGKVTGREGGRV